ncbi:heterokaryon incompatibility protein-domain-containing protein [Aspergillus spectabilis]
MPFEYQPLDPSKQEIRLLTILPHPEFESQINCTLRTVSLKQGARFEALSYVWGGQEATENVIVDGSPFHITPSLDSALRYLRFRRRPRVLWADYICINQPDLEEKSTQVPLMSLIYRSCTRVVCFLGLPSPRVKAMITWIDRYMYKRVNKRTLSWWKRDCKALFSTGARRQKDIGSREAYQGMFELLSLPYWTRMWTYQEFQLAKHEPICLLGWNVKFRAPDLGFEVLYHFAEVAFPVTDPSPFSHEPEEDQGGGAELQSFEPAHCQFFLMHADGRVRQPDTVGKLLITHLRRTTEHQCSDPRDKVYALYGMVPAAQNAYPADYKKPVEQVMKEVTKYMIDNEVGLQIFDWFPCRADNTINRQLPSWVLDYTQHRSHGSGRATQHIRHPTDKSLLQRASEHTNSVSTDLSTLRFWASSVGVCQVLFEFGSDRRAVAVQILQVLDTVPEPLASTWGPDTLSERLIQAFFCHETDEIDFNADEVISIIRAISTGATNAEAGWEDTLWQSVPYVLDGIRNKIVFLVNNEWGRGFGISGVAVADGDQVVLADDALHPLVLRRLQSQHRLLGQAFIDGLAESQIPNPFCDDVKRQPFQEFLVV